MLFNSFSFLVFFPIVFILYWLIGSENRKAQNIFLLISSLFFYGSWDIRFLGLLFFSILLDFFSGKKIHYSHNNFRKKIWLWVSIGINLGFLGFFKYFNFFIESFVDLFQNMGVSIEVSTLKIILPVGISFYTFHGLSYIIDIYKGRISSEKNFIDYALFVSYFPLLVAGPIERATHLLPQLKVRRTFDYKKSINALQQILWGLFKKVVIADQCALIVNDTFNMSNEYYGLTLVFGAVLFSIQIYCDFSGYSDIALGTSRLLGIELLQNFATPYFSRSIAEFWRRWHISLSSWFKDYVYIPLGGSKVSQMTQLRNTVIIFLLSGFWHGANWTFIVWGGLNALFILPSIWLKTNRKNIEIVASTSFFPNFKEILMIVTTFILTTITWIFFRANSVSNAILFFKRLFKGLTEKWVYFRSINFFEWKIGIILPILILLLIIIDWVGRKNNHPLPILLNKTSLKVRWPIYLLIILLIIYYSGDEQEFIYFQF